MAVYATVTQAIELYGESYISVACDRDLDGVVDTDSFEKHLRVASRQMDGYLLGRYALPLATPPEHFQKLCVDIAVYNGAPTADIRTQDMRDANKAALDYMVLIATNKVKLEVAEDTTAANAPYSAQIETRLNLSLEPCSREMRVSSLRKLM